MDIEQKRLFTAIILSAIVLFAWQKFFAPTNSIQAIQRGSDIKKTDTILVSNKKNDIIKNTSNRSFNISNGKVSYTLTENLSVVGAKNTINDSNLKAIDSSEEPMKFYVIRQDGSKAELKFRQVIKSSNKNVYNGEDNDYKINLKLYVDEKGFLNISLKSKTKYSYSVHYNLKKQDVDSWKDGKQLLIYNGKDVQRYDIGEDDIGEAVVSWMGVDFNYTLFAFISKEKLISKFRIYEDGKVMINFTDFTNNFQSRLKITKKNYNYLKQQADGLHLSIDFGLFAIVAVPLLKVLMFIYDYIPNYGVAIIILTLLFRLVTFPLQYKSFKSMKNMQKIQPHLKNIREKHKKDPQVLQRETMELFKREKVNPLGGCFPLLLQMPIFFAFYQVLRNSVELVNAPFIFWITDLSSKDPYYILPILMGITMMVQTLFTPSTIEDPRQKKIMLFMPVIFAFIMKDFSAGLNLYTFVSTFIGIVQQKLVYKLSD